MLSFSFTATLLVPEEYSSIQSAVDISSTGDTVLVSSGIYYENVYVNKEITFLSTDGPETTVIDGQGGTALNVEYYFSGKIIGFKIQNSQDGLLLGYSDYYQVINCIFFNNTYGI